MARFFLSVLVLATGFMNAEGHKPLVLDVIPYDKLVQGDADTLQTLHKALHEKGIVGVHGVPDYKKNMNSSLTQQKNLVSYLRK